MITPSTGRFVEYAYHPQAVHLDDDTKGLYKMGIVNEARDE
jgi:hypothetical protein